MYEPDAFRNSSHNPWAHGQQPAQTHQSSQTQQETHPLPDSDFSALSPPTQNNKRRRGGQRGRGNKKQNTGSHQSQSAPETSSQGKHQSAVRPNLMNHGIDSGNTGALFYPAAPNVRFEIILKSLGME